MVEPRDFLAIGSLVLLEGLLSGDNALVLAVLVKHLPGRDRQKALFYGIAGAFGLRFVGLALAAWFIRLWYMAAVGGLYLSYLAAGHFLRRKKNVEQAGAVDSRGPGLWRTVFVVLVVDFAFSMDSILVAVAVSNKLWVVVVGGCLGIVMMRIAAGLLIALLERYPSLEDMAYALVGWASVKMLVSSYGMFSDTVLGRHLPEHPMPEWLFWSVMGLIVIVGVLYSTRRQERQPLTEAPLSSRSARSFRTRLPKLSRYGFAGRLVMPHTYALRGRHLGVSGHSLTRCPVRHRLNRALARRNTASRASGKKAR